jgi:predicted ATPase
MEIKSFRLKNFKAVRDSGEVKFTPLTVFIGNNGSGKSSLIEGLETYYHIITEDLDEAMAQWRGYEHIHNLASLNSINGHEPASNAIEFFFHFEGDLSRRYPALENPAPILNEMRISSSRDEDRIFIETESFDANDPEHQFKRQRNTLIFGENKPVVINLSDARSAMHTPLGGQEFMVEFVKKWQFIMLNPDMMGTPKLQKRTGGRIALEKNGSNIAEYLLDIRRIDELAFNGILETLQYILPYAQDLQTNITSELERTVYLQMTEQDFKVPGWLLSTGTLRILALLAVFRHPEPPPLIVIEEIENGLDPRTIHLIVEEIQSVIESGLSQVIITTHSPYLLDLLSLSHIVLVERDAKHEPKFTRPADQASLQEWSKSFSPGQLYTMSRLSNENS